MVLSWLVHEFASQAQYSQLLLGIALILVTLFARHGITGLVVDGVNLVRRATKAKKPEKDASLAKDEKAEMPSFEAPAETGAVRHLTVSDDAAEVLAVDALSKQFGGVAAVHQVSLSLREGEVLGVIGPNGAGKTTLINMISGAMQPTEGKVSLVGKNVTGWSSHRMSRQGIARSYQQTSAFSRASVRENFARAKSFSRRWVTDEDLDSLLRITGLGGRLDDRAGDLPYGLQKLLGLLLPLATCPHVLLLDEPAAGLEGSERGRIDALVDWAVEHGSAVLLVEHDMDLVRRICPRLVVMDTGETLAEGETAEVLRDPAVITAYLGVQEDEETDTDIGGQHNGSRPDARADADPAGQEVNRV